jgi:3-hydroxymyristoyl/3-hydroxydecanoyl-(acyl carrier protein) dehydratase
MTTDLDFRLVARTATADGEVGTFTVNIPADLLYFEGHFPGSPILPAIAQLVALVLDRTHALWPELGQPRRVTRLKFMQAIAPGDEVEVRLERAGGDVRFTLSRGGEPCTRGALAFHA